MGEPIGTELESDDSGTKGDVAENVRNCNGRGLHLKDRKYRTQCSGEPRD